MLQCGSLTKDQTPGRNVGRFFMPDFFENAFVDKI